MNDSIVIPMQKIDEMAEDIVRDLHNAQLVDCFSTEEWDAMVSVVKRTLTK